MTSQKNARLQRELALFSDSPPHGISCWSKDGSLQHLEAQITGSESSPYANGIFKLLITVPDRYPFEPPNMQFVTPIYHPNIDSAGRICLDSLKMPPKGVWSPALNLSTLLTSIQLLMSEPNPDDPLMADIATELRLDQAQYERTARQWTQKHATTTNNNNTATSSNDDDTDATSNVVAAADHSSLGEARSISESRHLYRGAHCGTVSNKRASTSSDKAADSDGDVMKVAPPQGSLVNTAATSSYKRLKL